MAVALAEEIRDLAILASSEQEDDLSDALLVILRAMQLPRPVRRGLVKAVQQLVEAVEICESSAMSRKRAGIRVRPKLDRQPGGRLRSSDESPWFVVK